MYLVHMRDTFSADLAYAFPIVGKGAVESDLSPYLTRGGRMRRIPLLVVALAVALLAASGVALAVTKNCPGNCTGTNNPDRLIGSSQSQTMKGLKGGDSISGYRGDDDVVGGRGDDAVYGGLGDDLVYGNQGNDYVEGDYGHDYINTGNGSDKVAARDGYKDRVICGQGDRDLVYVDQLDVTKGCERTTNEKPSP
jgi:Ca2+-binding RTX toxin-like protein